MEKSGGHVPLTAPDTAVTWAIGSTQSVTFNHNLGVGATGVIDLTDHLVAGENVLLLAVRTSDGPPHAISATLELQFRNGAVATIGVDSSWSSRRRPNGRIPAQPSQSWTTVVVTGPPMCQGQFPAQSPWEWATF